MNTFSTHSLDFMLHQILDQILPGSWKSVFLQGMQLFMNFKSIYSTLQTCSTFFYFSLLCATMKMSKECLVFLCNGCLKYHWYNFRHQYFRNVLSTYRVTSSWGSSLYEIQDQRLLSSICYERIMGLWLVCFLCTSEQIKCTLERTFDICSLTWNPVYGCLKKSVEQSL